MKIARATALFVFIICSAMIFVACAPVDKVIGFFADDGTGHIFKIAIDSSPDNLDPQLASDKNSVMVAKNLFVGLMGYDENGRLIGRLARDYTISGDGLTYTFYLEPGYYWYCTGEFEAEVTAKDFVFGFRRLMDPKTASPHSEKYFCISGASAARNGQASPENIGVRAIDDYTVEFTLEYQNAEFLYLLAELPAMPCCEEFFNSAGGKYGLEAEATCSNGPFYLRYWLHDPYGKNNYVRLRKNPKYSQKSYVSPAGVNYLITQDFDERKTDFSSGSTDVMTFDAGSVAPIDGEYIEGYADTVGLVFNENIEAFADPYVRQVFSWAIDRSVLNRRVPELVLPAGGLIPDSGLLTSKGYSSRVPDDVTESNTSMAEYKWSFILDEGEKSELIGKTVMVPSSFEYGDYLEELTNSWYKVFNIHFRIETVNDRDYAARLESGEYDIALVTIHSDDASVIDYVEPFADGRFGIELSEALEAVDERGKYSSMSAFNFTCSEAELRILSDYHFIPIWHIPAVCCFDDDVEGLILDPFSGTVYFENAKMF